MSVDRADSGWLARRSRASRVGEVVFAVFFSVVCIVVATVDATVLAEVPAIIAIVLVVAGLAVALAGWTDRGSETLRASIPLASLVAVILLDLASRDSATGIAFLAVLPASWLGFYGSTALRVVVFALALGLIDPAAIAEPVTRPAAIVGPIVVLVATLAVPIVRRGLLRSYERESASSELLDRITDTVDVGIFALDRSGKELLTNATVKNHPLLAGNASVGDLERRGLLYGPDRVTPIAPDKGPLARAMRGESFSNQAYWVGPPDARQHAIVISATSLRDANGDYAGAVFAFDEVTEYVETLRAHEDFTATISHELRTPLTSIVGYLDLIRDVDEPIPAELETYLSVLQRNADRLERLVDDLIETAGEPEAARVRTVDVASAASAAVDRAEPAAQARGIRLHLNSSESLEWRTDAAKLGSALDKLLSNAVKFSAVGGDVTVTVSEREGHAVIAVADAGIGIPAREQHMLGTRFFRAANAREGAYQGAGLGFARAQELVRIIGGTLDVESTENEGTTVTLSLPLG